jgi:hypothetical protein
MRPPTTFAPPAPKPATVSAAPAELPTKPVSAPAAAAPVPTLLSTVPATAAIAGAARPPARAPGCRYTTTGAPALRWQTPPLELASLATLRAWRCGGVRSRSAPRRRRQGGVFIARPKHDERERHAAHQQRSPSHSGSARPTRAQTRASPRAAERRHGAAPRAAPAPPHARAQGGAGAARGRARHGEERAAAHRRRPHLQRAQPAAAPAGRLLLLLHDARRRLRGTTLFVEARCAQGVSTRVPVRSHCAQPMLCTFRDASNTLQGKNQKDACCRVQRVWRACKQERSTP